LNALELDIPNLFADLPLPRARQQVSKSKLRANRLAKRNAVIHADLPA
jgi:hypothetical protein